MCLDYSLSNHSVATYNFWALKFKNILLEHISIILRNYNNSEQELYYVVALFGMLGYVCIIIFIMKFWHYYKIISEIKIQNKSVPCQ